MLRREIAGLDARCASSVNYFGHLLDSQGDHRPLSLDLWTKPRHPASSMADRHARKIRRSDLNECVRARSSALACLGGSSARQVLISPPRGLRQRRQRLRVQFEGEGPFGVTSFPSPFPCPQIMDWRLATLQHPPPLSRIFAGGGGGRGDA